MRKFIPIAIVAAVGVVALSASPSFARQGADDGAGHVRHGGEGIGHPVKAVVAITGIV